ncbi:hypothetical protein ACLI09_05275 [Flavobacterium sp. RHBU_24]|uniref:DoxX family protein n=1 Tax=Flavobacterium sp. RHBU_24 TaxID=3391185 RepID=UPI003984A5BB
MKPLIVLLAVFFIALITSFILYANWNFSFSGRLALAVMLLFTAFGHFKFPEGMVLMMPDFIPAKKALVYVTGIMEIAFAVTIMIPETRYMAGIGLLIFLILIFPANIHASFNTVNIEEANYNGPGLKYLWFRIPFQLLLLLWVWIFCLLAHI